MTKERKTTKRLALYENGVFSIETVDAESGKVVGRNTVMRVVYADETLRSDLLPWLRTMLECRGEIDRVAP